MSDNYLPFSQRTGLEQIPPQLKVGEISAEMRRLIYYYLTREFNDGCCTNWDGDRFFCDSWLRVAQDFYVKILGVSIDEFPHNPVFLQSKLREIAERGQMGPLFDVLEFFMRHNDTSSKFKNDLADCLVETRSAYRFAADGQIIAIGTAEQAAAFETALLDADTANASGPRRHLIDAGLALRKGNWASSVRESIHAVESVAVWLAPGSKSLGDALKHIERQGHLHGQLKVAFEKLYTYTNSESGVRHANVFDGHEAQVDEADALFMLGACASFVSYLLARGQALKT